MSDIYNSIMFELKNLDGVKMLALAGRDGFLIGDNADDQKETLTLMSAAILKAAETVTHKLKKASPDRVIVDFDGGKIIAMTAGQKAFISVMTAQEASLPPIFIELERAAGKIKEIL